MNTHTKSGKSKKRKHNVPVDIQEQPVQSASVAPNIVTDEAPLVSADKQGKEPIHKPGYNKDGVHLGKENLVPYKFKPGQSGNPKGRPKDPLKAIGLRIAQLKANKVLKPKEQKYLADLGLDTADITTIEYIMATLATSKNPLKIQMYLERTFGKVPNINLNAEINTQLVMRFRSKFTDSELEQIANGADALELLLDKLPDVDGDEADDNGSHTGYETNVLDGDWTDGD